MVSNGHGVSKLSLESNPSGSEDAGDKQKGEAKGDESYSSRRELERNLESSHRQFFWGSWFFGFPIEMQTWRNVWKLLEVGLMIISNCLEFVDSGTPNKDELESSKKDQVHQYETKVRIWYARKIRNRPDLHRSSVLKQSRSWVARHCQYGLSR